MRVKNKEIRRRRHRKEQVVKAAAREIRAQFSDKEPKKAPAPVKKSPAKKKAD